MKTLNQKYIILSIALALMFLLTYKTNAQLDNCYTPEENETCTDWEPAGFDFTYMGCTVHVDYYYRTCTKTVNGCQIPRIRKQVRIWQTSWSENCTALQQAIFPGYPNDFSTMNYYQFALLFNQANERMGINEFSAYYDANPELQSGLNCVGTPPNCSDPSTGPCNFSVYYSNFSCQMLCWYYKDPQTGGSGPGVIVNNYSCTSESSTCCEHIAYYCKCGDEVRKLVTVTGSSFCNDAVPPYESCFPKTGYTSYPSPGCITICQ